MHDRPLSRIAFYPAPRVNLLLITTTSQKITFQSFIFVGIGFRANLDGRRLNLLAIKNIKSNHMKNWITICLLSLPLGLAAQMIDPVLWDFELKNLGEDEYEVRLTASLEAGWYIYSANLESYEGPIQTSISFSAPADVEIVGAIEEEGKKVEGYDELFGMNVIKYASEVVFSQKIKAEDLELLEGNVRFMTCDDHKCLPPKQISFELQPE